MASFISRWALQLSTRAHNTQTLVEHDIELSAAYNSTDRVDYMRQAAAIALGCQELEKIKKEGIKTRHERASQNSCSSNYR